MRGQSLCIALCIAMPFLAFASLPSLAATSPAMKACSKQWDAMKAAGQTEGKTWSSFWSQCSKDFAAGGAAAPATSKKSIAKTTTTARNEDDSAASAQQKKDCDAKWDANKARTGAHGWHDYFQFMANCM